MTPQRRVAAQQILHVAGDADYQQLDARMHVGQQLQQAGDLVLGLLRDDKVELVEDQQGTGAYFRQQPGQITDVERAPLQLCNGTGDRAAAFGARQIGEVRAEDIGERQIAADRAIGDGVAGFVGMIAEDAGERRLA